MLGSWTLEIDGRSYAVTVDRGPNGKDVVRVNGRVAARPISSEENDRQFVIGTRAYVVRRSGASYELVEDTSADVHARSVDMANAVLAYAEEQTLPLERDPLFTRLPIVGWVAIAAFVVVALVWATGPSYEKLAAKRVDQMLSEMKHGTGLEAQFAVTLWAKNRRVLDAQEMSWASDHFDQWRREKDLYRSFDSYTVTHSSLVKGEAVPTAIVTFTIEGREYKVRVPKDQPIRWSAH